MYVKWVVRRHKNEELANINFYDAYLVQSYKNEVGEPRQRTICYLGNLRQIDNAFPVIERALFYLRMEETLQRHLPGYLQSVEERVKLYQGLAAVVALPTPDEMMQGEEFHKRWQSNYWKALREATGNIPPDVAGFFTVQEQMLDGVISQIDESEVSVAEPASFTPYTEGPLDHITIIGRLSSKSNQER